MAGVIDFGKRIKQKLFGSRQMTPAEDAVIKKTLQEIIFDQSKENVNPDYVKVQAAASKNARLQALANTGMSLYDPMYLDAESLEYDTIFVDQKAQELGDKVRDKLIVSLGGYCPQGDFAEEFDGYFRPFIKTMMEEAYRQREEVDFGQVCDRITRLVQNSNYFENSSDLIYDTKLELRPNVNHIIDDNITRFPQNLQSMDKYQLGVLLQGTINDAIRRIRRKMIRSKNCRRNSKFNC